MRLSPYAFVFLLCLPFALVCCATPDASSMDVAQVRKSIEEASGRFARAFNRGDATNVAAMYTDDATILPPNGEMIQGREGFQGFWAGAIEVGMKDVTLTTVDVGGSGDTAYEIGKYTLKIQPEGREGTTDAGKYVLVWGRLAAPSFQVPLLYGRAPAPDRGTRSTLGIITPGNPFPSTHRTGLPEVGDSLRREAGGRRA